MAAHFCMLCSQCRKGCPLCGRCACSPDQLAGMFKPFALPASDTSFTVFDVPIIAGEDHDEPQMPETD